MTAFLLILDADLCEYLLGEDDAEKCECAACKGIARAAEDFEGEAEEWIAKGSSR